jgi:hypothetical protein
MTREEMLAIRCDACDAEPGVPCRHTPLPDEPDEPQPPSWACKRWGQWEHDWLDCPDCIEAYEAELESDQGPPE